MGHRTMYHDIPPKVTLTATPPGNYAAGPLGKNSGEVTEVASGIASGVPQGIASLWGSLGDYLGASLGGSLGVV